MSKRIFISYKRVDKNLVLPLKQRIESAIGEECWLDISGIESDAQFMDVIINAINACEIFLFMYSEAHSKITNPENDWTCKELNFAKSKGKRIVFINLDGTQLTDRFEFDFGTKQHIDSRSDEQLSILCKDICNWLGKETSQKVVPAPTQEKNSFNIFSKKFNPIVNFGICAQLVFFIGMVFILLLPLMPQSGCLGLNKGFNTNYLLLMASLLATIIATIQIGRMKKGWLFTIFGLDLAEVYFASQLGLFVFSQIKHSSNAAYVLLIEIGRNAKLEGIAGCSTILIALAAAHIITMSAVLMLKKDDRSGWSLMK